MADVGVPDGLIGAFTVHPHRRLAFHVGGGHNSMSPGLRAGVQLYALTGAAAPYMAVEAGYFFSGPANSLAQGIALQAGVDRDTQLEEIGYSFANGHLGLRLGSRSAAVYLQAGISMVRTSATSRESRDIEMSPNTTVDVLTESVFRIWTPSGRIGLITYF